MKKTTKKLIALLLTAAMVLGLFSVAAFAVEVEPDPQQLDEVPNYGLINQYHVGTQAVTDAYLRGESLELNGVNVAQPTRDIPSSWDSRNYNWITSVKNQGSYGSCWAHAAMGSVEAYMIKEGIPVGTGSAATTSLNLSETQHCFFNYSTAYDAEGMLTGDACTLTGSDSCLDSGGNGEMSAYTLQRWCGAADESQSALQYSKASTVARSGLDSQYSYQYNVCHVQNSLWIPATNIDAVKQGIMDYGAGNISYYAGNSNYTYNCTIDTSSQESSSHKWANHAITLVGWDDTIAASNFSPNKPSGNGAWLCRNSWGTSYFNQGYMWISYEDTSVLEGYIYFYDAESIDNYDHNYQYDGSCNVVTYGVGNRVGFANNTKVANVFTAKGNELLRAVALCNWDEALSYTVEIYKNPTTGNPTSGTLMTSQTGTLTYSGYYTIPLNNPVSLSAGDTFSVVFTQSCPEADDSGKYIHTPYDSTFNDTSLVSWCTWVHANHGNTSYYKEPNGSWTDCPDNGDYRIKAYTDDVTFTLTAVSNNTSYGTVSVSGSTITATPAAGYYVESCDVISGTATCTINGNIITVSASADCTVRVNFAPKPTYTVTFVASGNVESTQSALVLDAITLPTTVSTTATGWTFVGWMDHQIDETAEKPSYYAPGASYTVNGNATLYAVYARVEEGTGSVIYQQVNDLEDDAEYILVDVNAISGTSGYAVGNAIVADSHYLTAVSVTVNSDNTVTATSANLPNILWKADAVSNGFTFYNQNVGKYMGLDSSEYLYPSATALAWAYTSEGYMNNQIDSEGYYYLSYDTTNTRYTTNMSGRVINLYKAVNDSTTYYWTDPIAGEHEHELVFHAAAAPTCTEVGNSAYYQCSICGKCFTDAAGENEITLASTVIAALGHNYVGVVTAPTETQQGYTTYTCSRCGDQYVDDYVPALGSDFTVHFSVPAGVTKPADMVSNTNTGITLPTVTGPEGYTFLGWVTEDYDNVETRPATILTGNYIAPQEITLKALFSYVGDGSGETVYQLVDALKDGGKYIIVDSNSISGTSGYAVGNTIVASNHYLNAVSVTINDNTATASNVANVLWQAAAASNGFTFYNAAVGKYMGLDSSEYLYPSDTAVAWAYTSDSYLDNQIDSEGYYYLSFDTTNTRYTTNKSGKVIYLYEETTLGTTLYTTIIGEEHVHTPGNPVVENNVEPTCTAAGSYDNVVYCTECGEELSRETVTVPALGHAPLAAVVENNVEPTCTVAGSYDNVVYCERCNAELSRETVTVAALNHLPGAAVQENYVEPTATEYGGYDMVVYCQRCNAELSREHTVLDPTGTPEPELDESLTFYTSITIGVEMKTTFTIRQTVLTNAASWYLEVSKLDGSGNVLESKRFGEGQEGAVSNVNNVAWRAIYTDITAKEMGVTFSAVLHVFDADGNEFYGEAIENTVKDYIVGELVKTDNTAATRTLCADMLNYGAAAQLYFAYDTDNLVNENLSAAAAAALDQFETKTEAPATLVNGSNGPNLYGSVSVKNRVVLSITGRSLGTEGTVQIQVKNHANGAVKEVLETTKVGSVYTAKFSNVEADEMRTMFDFVALVDGVETGTPLSWSVEGYIRAARLSSDTSAEELALLNALLVYTDSAAAMQ